MRVAFDSDRRFTFPVPPQQLWSVIEDTTGFQRWWPWLRRFDAKGFVAGDEWRCLVQPPLPYQVAFTITLVDVDAPHRAVATVRGDIAGTATLTIAEHPDGCEARLVSSLGPSNPLLRGVAVFARPLVRYGHDWVLDQGARQFAARALGP
jgi:uncharacterized protein YndB with AHSA1/START domain